MSQTRVGSKRGRQELGWEQDLGLPTEIWTKIAGHLDENNLFAFALTCKEFRQIQEEVYKKRSNKKRKVIQMWKYLKDPSLPLSREWLRWSFSFAVKRDETKNLGKFLTALAALHGYLPEVKWLAAECHLDWAGLDTGIIQAAASRGGCLKVLEWLSQESSWSSWSGELAAAARGHLEVLKYFRRGKEGQPSEWLAHAAAGGGHIEVLKYLKSEGCPMNESTICSAAAGRGHHKVVEWITQHAC